LAPKSNYYLKLRSSACLSRLVLAISKVALLLILALNLGQALNLKVGA